MLDKVRGKGACVLSLLAGDIRVGIEVRAFVVPVGTAAIVVAAASRDSDKGLLGISSPPFSLLGDGDGDDNAAGVVSS